MKIPTPSVYDSFWGGGNMTIGSRIRKLRIDAGMSQSKLAKKLGTNLNSVQKWETDLSRPSIQNIIRLADIFQVSTDYLLLRENSPTISLYELSDTDIKRIRAIVQAYKDNTPH